MKVFFRFFRDYPRESILAPLFKLLEACFDLLVPIVVAQIIDGGIRGGQGDGFIWRRAGVLVLLAVVGLTCTIIAQYFSAKAAVGTATNLRHDLFAVTDHGAKKYQALGREDWLAGYLKTQRGKE